jgi:hypothetical protein
MKTGKSLTELAKTLEDIKAKGRDFMVPTTQLKMNPDLTLSFPGLTVESNDYAKGQIASYAGVPKAYFDKLQTENKELLSRNVNHGFVRQADSRVGGKPEARMVRTYDNKVRALLSSSYRRLDSYDLCNELLPMLADNRMEVDSSEITESRLYLKALMPKLKTEVKQGDVVQYGIMISNSDVGAGAVRVEPLIYRLVCKNGMIASTSIRKFHAGRNMAGDDIQELLSASTQKLTDAAFWAQVRDIVAASMRPEVFEAEVDRLRVAAGLKITNFALPEVVEMTMKAVGVSGEGVKNSIVGYLANGADGAGLTQWGLVNGFTYAAQMDALNYDQSVELERAGSKVLELKGNAWKRIAEAA